MLQRDKIFDEGAVVARQKRAIGAHSVWHDNVWHIKFEVTDNWWKFVGADKFPPKTEKMAISNGDFPIAQIIILAVKTLIKSHGGVSKHSIERPATIIYENPCNESLVFVSSS